MDSETKLVGLYSTEFLFNYDTKNTFLDAQNVKTYSKMVSVIINNFKKGTV